jgi:hypothetical protein
MIETPFPRDDKMTMVKTLPRLKPARVLPTVAAGSLRLGLSRLKCEQLTDIVMTSVDKPLPQPTLLYTLSTNNGQHSPTTVLPYGQNVQLTWRGAPDQ